MNVGTGEDLSIQDLALLVAQTVGYEGTVSWDHSRPDGTPRKLLDVSQMSELGWDASISLKDGMVDVYKEFKQSLEMETMRG